ncbi:hypothetical protein BV20DRAFT_143288 [Pilatotrama ljubarskyi]|nr:hypothetical protein BV20DRAFT_143288 [Pilatotrama ljubarskyi]
MPQRPVASQGGLPQRPGPHIQPAHAAKVSLPPALHLFSPLLTCLPTRIPIQMPQREVCRNFQAGFCGWGDKCHRSHVLDGGLYAPNFVAPTRRGPPDVRPGQLAPPLHPASTVGSVASVNYININRPQQASSTGPDGLTQPAAAATSDARSSKPPGVNHLHPPPPPAVLPGIAPRTNVASQAVRPEPTILDVNRLMRAAELDPRPSRRTNVVCRDYQKGLCRHGDRCPGTHIFLVPQECITQLLPPPEKPAVRKIPATVTYTAADGSMHEREVCKTWAAGLCPKGDTCRFAHVTEDELEEEEFTGESDSSETCPTTGDIETEVEPTAFERHGNASREVADLHDRESFELMAQVKGTAGRPGQGVARRASLSIVLQETLLLQSAMQVFSRHPGPGPTAAV